MNWRYRPGLHLSQTMAQTGCASPFRTCGVLETGKTMTSRAAPMRAIRRCNRDRDGLSPQAATPASGACLPGTFPVVIAGLQRLTERPEGRACWVGSPLPSGPDRSDPAGFLLVSLSVARRVGKCQRLKYQFWAFFESDMNPAYGPGICGLRAGEGGSS